jgi:hypothetical protein
MPLLAKKLKNGYNYQDNIKHESKALMDAISGNLRAKNNNAIKEEKPPEVEGGIKRHIKTFDKKIKQKYLI